MTGEPPFACAGSKWRRTTPWAIASPGFPLRTFLSGSTTTTESDSTVPPRKKELQERFKHIGFPFDHPLRPGQDREGFLFFQLPKSQHPLEAIEAVTLRLGGIRSPEQGEVSLELTLRSRASQEKPDKSATSR